MHPTAEKRLVLLFYILTEVVLYALALRVASLSVLDTLGGLDWNALQRDRFLVIALYAATALLTGAFDIHRLTGRFDAIYALLGALAVALLLQLALATLLPAGWRVLSRREMVAGAGVALLLLGGWRFLATGFLSRFASIHRRFHVLGDPEEGRRIAAAINSDTQLHAEASHCTLDALRAHCAERGSAATGVAAIKIVIQRDGHIFSSDYSGGSIGTGLNRVTSARAEDCPNRVVGVDRSVTQCR